MKDAPLVSIVVPTYNRAHIILETLESVKSQSYQNWECLVIDDGSSDHTEKLLQGYIDADNRFKYLVRPNNFTAGGNGARNYGFEKSKGVLLQWLDSDDLLKPSKIEKQVEQFVKNENLVLSLCGVLIFSETEVYSKKNSNIPKNKLFDAYASKESSIGTNQPLWKKKFLENKVLYDEDIVKGQDYDFFVRMFSAKNLVYDVVQEKLVLVRTAGANRISKVFKKNADTNAVNSYLIGYKRAYKIMSQKENEEYYIKLSNLIIKKLTKILWDKNFDIVIETLKFMKINCYQDKIIYKLHFTKAILIIKTLKITKLKGYSILKNKLQLDEISN